MIRMLRFQTPTAAIGLLLLFMAFGSLDACRGQESAGSVAEGAAPANQDQDVSPGNAQEKAADAQEKAGDAQARNGDDDNGATQNQEPSAESSETESGADSEGAEGDAAQGNASANGQVGDSPPSSGSEAAGTGTDAGNGDEPEESTAELAVQAGGFRSPRRTLRTFYRAMERRDYETAVAALDFSAVEPPPDTFEQVRLAQKLIDCLDRLGIVDDALISDDVSGPPVPFPPDVEDSSVFLSRSPDERWQFAADTVAKIDAIHEILKDRTPVTETEEEATDESEAAPAEETSETTESETTTTEVRIETTSVPDGLQSARQTMRTLFDSLDNRKYSDAVSTLDFTRLEEEQPDLSPYSELATVRRLRDIIDRMAKIDYALISDDPMGPAFRFPPDELNQPIEIVRQNDGRWQFSADTVDRIDALDEIYKNKPVLNLPEEQKPWYERELLLGNETWRILSLFLSVFAALFVGQLIKTMLLWRSRTLEKRGKGLRPTVLKTIASTSVGLFFLLGLSLGLSSLILEHSVSELVRTTIHIVFAVVIGYICFRLVDVVVEIVHEFSTRSGSTLNNMLAPIISMSLRLTIIVLVLLEIATAISDQPPSAVLAGLGAGGLAVGLAAQETLKNLFGSVMIFVDHPFEIGDRIVIDGHDGPVESVGFRSTRIRTLDGHLVTVPNGELANRTIHNVGKRPYIRRVFTIRLAYDLSPEKVAEAVSIVKELLDAHEGMDESKPPRVFIGEFEDSAIQLKVFYWYHPPDYWEYCRFGEEVNLKILQRFRDAEIRFALPSQRLFVSGELGGDEGANI